MGYTTQLSIGSQGDDVKKLQQTLVDKGFLKQSDVDGIIGKRTEMAIKNYQGSVGLERDGIVGDNTYAALYGNSGSTNKTTTPTVTESKPTYTAPTYTESGIVQQAQAALNAQLSQKPGAYQSQWQTQLDDTIGKILNREQFSFDLNGDALYQQMAEEYSRRGNLAMMDTMGQAAAMTGGFGNSYAQSVGQQAYQAHLQELNEVIPEIYQMQLDKYNMEGQELYDQYAMLGDRENLDYGRYRDEVSDWLTERDYLTDRYDAERNFDYGKYVDDRDFGYGAYRDSMSDYEWQTSFDYQKARDNVADSQWQKEYDLAASKVVGNTGGDNPTGVNPTGGSISESDIKKMQAAIGVNQDGKWGPKSTAAAGGLSLEEAYKAWKNGTLKKVETKTWQDFSQEELEKNQKEYGGSYYSTVLNDLKGMKTSGKSNAEVNAYLQELLGNSLISQSEYQTLYNKYRDNNLK